ncbi:MAG: tRNA pseudouridine(55) synthase TruB [Acetobacterales bacterium]
MGRRRGGTAVHGWLVVDKPEGLSSADVVNRVKRLFDARKCGHGGTLDPLATGVLPVAFGEATKTVAYAMDRSKAYRFLLRWGEARSTDDREGEVTETSPTRPDEAAIDAALDAFVGEIEQVPPVFSAIKVGGERAYRLARADKEVTLEARTVRVESLRRAADGKRNDADHTEFEVVCGKGTYVRSLARDLARALGSCGHVAAIRRTRVGGFRAEDAISLASLISLGHSAAAFEWLKPVETALDDIPALAVTGDEANQLRSGQPVSVVRMLGRLAADASALDEIGNGSVVVAMAQDRPVALTRLDRGRLCPFRVLNL